MGTTDVTSSQIPSNNNNNKNGGVKPVSSTPPKGEKPIPPTPQSPSSGRSSSFKRNGSQGKGPVKTTTPQRPMLATEARSLVRPCGCGKDGVFKAHGHAHDSHHRVPVTPERTLREPRTPKSPQVTRKTKVAVPPAEQQNIVPLAKPPSPKPSPPKPSPPKPSPSKPPAKPSTPLIPLTKSPKSSEDRGPNKYYDQFVKNYHNPNRGPVPSRFVSTVVWLPELQPEFNSTTLKLSPGEDSSRYVDEILLKEYDNYLKRMLPNSGKDEFKLEEPLYVKKVSASNLRNPVEANLVPPNMRTSPVTLS